MHYLQTLLILVTFAPALLAHGAASTTLTPEWVHQEKIRAYWSPPLDLIEPLHDAGFNTIIQRLEIAVSAEQRASGSLYPNHSFASVEASMRASSQKARALGMRYFHCIDPGAAGAIISAGFKDNPRRFHDGKLPCPLDAVYWERVIAKRFLSVIDLLAGDEYQLDGLIIDPEMYSFNGAFMTLPCYCDHCAADFAATTPEAKALPTVKIDERADWLSTQRDAYVTWQQETVTARVAAMRSRIHAKRPDLILGFLIFRDRPWFKAMAAGLATAERPVLICPEGTYSGAFNDDYLAYQTGLAEKVGVPFLYCPGVWVGFDEKKQVPTAFLEVVPGNIYERSIRSAGYWVYATHRWGGNGERATPFTTAFRKINDELDRHQASPATYTSDLVAQSLPVERPGNLHELLLEARDWKRPTTVPPSVPPSTGIVALRGQHQAVINAKKGDQISITLRNIQLGSYTSEGRVVLYDPGMAVIADESCGVNKSIEHTFTADRSGPYVVVASAGSGVPNAFTIRIQGAPWVLSGDRISLNKSGGSVYFWMAEDRESFDLSLSGSGKETVTYTLYGPDGKSVLHREGVGTRELHAVDCRGKAGVWTLEATDIVDDGYFSISGVERFALDPAYVVVDE